MSSQRRKTLSVVIPVGTGSHLLSEVLTALNDQVREPDEVIIVDDRVKDDSLDCVDKVLHLNHKIVKTSPETGRYGVSSARNTGAENSNSDIILFLDSDVILPQNYIQKLIHLIDEWDGILGIQSLQCGYDDFFSNFKNLWMRFTYERLSSSEVGLFYTSCAGILREAFFTTGGFDEAYRKPGVEDTIFGNKLLKYKLRVCVCEGLEFVHKRRYTFTTALKTDFMRSKELTRYFISSFRELAGGTNTSVPVSYFLSIPLVFGGLISLCFVFINPLILILSGLLIISPTILTHKFLMYIKDKVGIWFMLKSVFYQYAVFLVSGLGIITGVISSIVEKLRS